MTWKVTLAKINGPVTTNHMLGLLLMMPQGTRASFDKKTHRRVLQRTTRLTYIYLAARLLEKRAPEDITEDVLSTCRPPRGPSGVLGGK